MHFLGHGVAQQFWRLICGEFQSDGDEQHVFALRALQPETIGQLIEESRGTIPVAFQGTWKNVAKYSRRYRAVDWIDFLMHVAPTVILDNLKHEDTKRAAFSLLRACSIALQWHLTEDDIRQIERYVLASSFLLACLHCIVYSFVSFRCVQQWHQFLRREVNTGKLSVAGFTANQHYLRHMSLVVRALGPLRAYSARPLERAIGQYSKMIRSRSRPGAQASNVMYKISAIRYAQRTVPAMRKQASLDSSKHVPGRADRSLGTANLDTIHDGLIRWTVHVCGYPTPESVACHQAVLVARVASVRRCGTRPRRRDAAALARLDTRHSQFYGR